MQHYSRFHAMFWANLYVYNNTKRAERSQKTRNIIKTIRKGGSKES